MILAFTLGRMARSNLTYQANRATGGEVDYGDN